MEEAVLIQFKLPRKKDGVTMSKACRLYRKLYGYINASYYGKYHTRVPGLLDQIPSIRYPGSTIMMRRKDSTEVIRLLKNAGAEIHQWKVTPNKEEAKKLLK